MHQIAVHKEGPQADVRIQDNSGATPILLAAASGHGRVLRVLARGAPDTLATQDSRGRTPLYAASDAGHKEVVSQLLRLVITAESDGEFSISEIAK